jgi:hypothetical protein
LKNFLVGSPDDVDDDDLNICLELIKILSLFIKIFVGDEELDKAEDGHEVMGANSSSDALVDDDSDNDVFEFDQNEGEDEPPPFVNEDIDELEVSFVRFRLELNESKSFDMTIFLLLLSLLILLPNIFRMFLHYYYLFCLLMHLK